MSSRGRTEPTIQNGMESANTNATKATGEILPSRRQWYPPVDLLWISRRSGAADRMVRPVLLASLLLAGAAQGSQCVFVSGPNGFCLAVRLVPDHADLRVGSTLQVRANGGGGACTVGHGSRWHSTRPDVATVDSTGLVRALGPGSAEIRMIADGESTAGSAAMAVNVAP